MCPGSLLLTVCLGIVIRQIQLEKPIAAEILHENRSKLVIILFSAQNLCIESEMHIHNKCINEID